VSHKMTQRDRLGQSAMSSKPPPKLLKESNYTGFNSWEGQIIQYYSLGIRIRLDLYLRESEWT
jgi:hypothetical protein